MPGVKYDKNVNTSKDAWEQLEKLAKSIDSNAKKYRYGYSGNSEKTGHFCITPDGFEGDKGNISWKDATKITEADFKRYLKESIITRKEVCAYSSRKFRFSDGSIITASCAEEAKSKHKVMAAEGNPYRNILEELGFKRVINGKYYMDLTNYRFEYRGFEGPEETYKSTLSLGASNFDDKFSLIYVYRRNEEEDGDILCTIVKNDKDFKKNVQKLIVKATKIASLFEKWCDK